MSHADPRDDRDQLIAELTARVELERWFGLDFYRSAPRATPPVAASPPPLELRNTGEDPERRRKLEELRANIENCHQCALGAGRGKFVFGTGRADARLFFVGEAPGEEEDRQGEPFVGRAGQLLTRMIESGMGLRRSDVYIGNVLKCRPPNNRPPSLTEMAVCLPYLIQQIEIIRPEIVCALGGVALKALLQDPEATITRMRGRFIDWRGIRLMPTFHPSYLLRAAHEKRKAWQDLQKIMTALGLPIPKREREG